MPAATAITLPGSTRVAAASATAAFAADSRPDLASKPGSSMAVSEAETAPPCTFFTTPERSSASRSRRTVMSETPNWSTSSATRTAPLRRTISAISACRWWASSPVSATDALP